MDFPPRLPLSVNLAAAVGEVDREIVVQRVEVEEVLLDLLALVAERDHELSETLARVDVEDVPENRLAADLDHGLGTDGRLFLQPAAHPSGQDRDLHAAVPAGIGHGRAVERIMGTG